MKNKIEFYVYTFSNGNWSLVRICDDIDKAREIRNGLMMGVIIKTASEIVC